MKPNKGTKHAKRAFSLPMVMLVLLFATGLIVALTTIYENYVGRSYTTLQLQEEYNILQDAVERGRSLIRSQDYPELDPSSSTITRASSLLIPELQFNYSVTKMRGTARVFVEIYDSKMDGNSTRLNYIKNDLVERKKMPTLMVPQMGDMQGTETTAADVSSNKDLIGGTKTTTGVGVYTIRARIEPSLRNRSLELLTTMEK